MSLIKNCLYLGDCLTTCKGDIPSNCIDLIIADPPYFKIAGEYDFIWNNVDEYIAWFQPILQEFERILKPNGSLYLWGKIGYNKGFALPKLAIWVEKEGLFKIVNWITQKNTHGRGTKKGYMECREELLYMVKPGNTSYTWNKSYTNTPSTRTDAGYNGKPRKNTQKRCTDTWIDLEYYDPFFTTSEIWSDISEASQSSKQRFVIPSKMNSSSPNFQGVKNVQLCDRIINASSNPKDLVFIPFAGTGSEIISCIQNARNFIACEINQEYVDSIIYKRLLTLKTSENIRISFFNENPYMRLT